MANRQAARRITPSEKRISVLGIFLSFLKIGTIGFGGGSALIPVVEKELVQDRQALNEQDYLKHTVVANITPGALPVKLGATCGFQLRGVAGALAGAYGTTLPGVFLTVLFMALFSVLGEGALRYFNYASVGITAFIVFLLFTYVIRTVQAGAIRVNLGICLAAFALTGGKEVREILGLLFLTDAAAFGVPLFDISTIDLILLAFFVILLLDKLRSKAELLAVFGVCAAYSFLVGKTGRALGPDRWSGWMLLAMLLTVVLVFAFRRNKTGMKANGGVTRAAVLVSVLFLIIPLLLSAVLALSVSDGRPGAAQGGIAQFIGLVASSTVTSFGGGEAYVSVADGIFVQGGFIRPDTFYTQLVPVANSLPGPILVKIAAGIGYGFGAAGGNPASGWALALASMLTAIGACATLAVLVMSLYDSVKQWQFIADLKKYILPVICGMLLSTSCAMLFESMKITGEKGIPGFMALPAVLLIVWFISLLHKRFRLHDVILLIAAAGFTLAALAPLP